MIGGGRVRAMDRDDDQAGQQLVEACPVGCLQLAFNLRNDATAVMVVNLQAERPRPAGNCVADPPHPYDAEALSTDAVTEHPGWRPARPLLFRRHHRAPFGPPAPPPPH